MARIRTVLRRTSAAWTGDSIAASLDGERGVLRPPLVIDNDTPRALYQGKHVDLTRTEFELLRVDHCAPERVFLAQLLDRMFGESYAVTDRTIDAHIKALRRKLSQSQARL